MIAVTDLTVVENHARIPDTKVQEALEFGRINDLHRVILKHLPELETYGGVFCQTGKKPPAGSQGGRPTVTYMLTEEQAVLICMFARTPKAAEARRMIVDVFMRWRRGEALPQPGTGDGITIPKDDYIALLQTQNALLKGGLVEPRAPRKASVPLSDAEKHDILRMCTEGLGVNEIARRTGRSNACISLLRAGFRLIDGGAA